MAISFVGSNIALGESVAIPSHQPGDLIFIAAWSKSFGSVFGLDETFNATSQILSIFYGTGISFIHAAKIAASYAETSGVFTSASCVAAAVYRGTPKFIVTQLGYRLLSANTNIVTYPSYGPAEENKQISATRREGAWLHGVQLSTAEDSDTLTPPAGYVIRDSLVHPDIGTIFLYDTNSYVISVDVAQVISATTATNRPHSVIPMWEAVDKPPLSTKRIRNPLIGQGVIQ